MFLAAIRRLPACKLGKAALAPAANGGLQSTGALVQEAQQRFHASLQTSVTPFLSQTAESPSCEGPYPMSQFLEAVVNCNQYTLCSVAKDMGITVQKIKWTAAGKYGNIGSLSSPALSQIHLDAELDTSPELHPEELKSLALKVKEECMVATTLKAAGTDINIELRYPHKFVSSMGLHL